MSWIKKLQQSKETIRHFLSWCILGAVMVGIGGVLFFILLKGVLAMTDIPIAQRNNSLYMLKLLGLDDIPGLVKGIYSKGASGKKLGQTDQRYMKRAEDTLYGELAVALDLTPAEVPAYIKSVIEGK